MIDRQTVERIKDAANIVDVVSEFVTLRKAGANYKGLCPFHNEKTPSFVVTPARGTCHCFGCGKGGNPVSFIMEHEQMTYTEALRWLAKKYNIEIKEREMSNEEREAQNERESMFIVNEWTADYFENLLHNDPDGLAVGMQYFRQRGFRDDVMRKFRLGFDSKNRHALAQTAKANGYNEQFLLKTGICYQNDRGELIDRYAERVIFPWINISGKVVGFSARVLDSRTKGVNQKYVNSPDSDIYHKERELFGIWQAKKAIAKEDRVFIVEGQTDVISMHQCGIENVVANSGTALSIHQIHILHRFTSNITLLYDGDSAGIHATLRGTDMLLSEGMLVKVLFLPDGDDPDSFSRKHTEEEFRQYVEQHQQDFLQFKVDFLLKEAKDPQQRSEAIDSIVKSIAYIPNQILRDTYVREASQRIGINEVTIISRMNTLIKEQKENAKKSNGPQQQSNGTPARTSASSSPTQTVERLIAQLVVREGDSIIYNNVEDEEGNLLSLNIAQAIYVNLQTDGLNLSVPAYARILEEAVMHSEDPGFNASLFFINHEDIEVAKLAAELSQDQYLLNEKEKECSELERKMEEEKRIENLRLQTERLMLDFRVAYVDAQMRSLQQMIVAASADPERTSQLMADFIEIQRLRNEIAKQVGKRIL